MDPEQTFLRVHARLSGMLTPRFRLALEYIYLTVAVAIFCLLVVMHTNFVQQPGCSGELAGIEFTEAQLVQIKIVSGGLLTPNTNKQNMEDSQKQGAYIESSISPGLKQYDFTVLTAKFWSNWIGSGARRSKLFFISWKSDKEIIEPQIENVVNTAITKSVPGEIGIIDDAEELQREILNSARQSFKVAVINFGSKWKTYLSSFWKYLRQFVENASQSWNNADWKVFLNVTECLHKLLWEPIKSSVVIWFEKKSKTIEPTYLYTVEKGYFLLPEAAKSRHNIQTVNITISAQSSCFGNRWQQVLINNIVGYDTILMNSLLSSPGQGYLYNFQTKEFYDLSYGHELSGGPAGFGDYVVTKCGVLIMSLFVFFTTTMSVSFTLRETQSRMLNFTVQLQHHARHQLPTFQLIFVHVIESLIFVPIMIGILFFLFEFYDDQLLAFLVLTLVWLCELFTMISVRTSISMQFFPRFFMLYFLVFHIYFFSYANGFSYLAFSATAAFMQHLILYFWNRFEVPALQRFMRSRGQLQQQAAVQITSSAIYTSTLHIASVNMRNTQAINNELQDGPELRSGTDNTLPDSFGGVGNQEQSGMVDSPGSMSNPIRFPNLNPQQRGATFGSSLLNPFGSLLLRILGGASPDGITSFSSMSRDVRDQGQAYAQPTQQENEQMTDR